MLQRLCMVLMALITLVVCRIVSRGGVGVVGSLLKIKIKKKNVDPSY